MPRLYTARMSIRIAPRPRLTVLLGAGASIPSGGPSTKTLTQTLMRQLHDRKYSLVEFEDGFKIKRVANVAVPRIIERTLRRKFRKRFDFELFLDALEQLQPLASPGAIDDSVTTAFFKQNSSFADLLTLAPLHSAHEDAIRGINEIASSFKHKTKIRGLSIEPLLERLHQHFDLTVANLNYDTITDGAAVDWFDGFSGTGEFQTFDPRHWNEHKRHRSTMMHLHGSVRWGYAPMSIYGFEAAQFTDALHARDALHRGFARRDTVQDQWFGFTPIISGLHKGGRFIYNARPYGYYFQECVNALVENARLLIIGYSFRDRHLNEWIEEYVRVHGDERQPAVITVILGKDVGEQHSAQYWMLTQLAGVRRFNDGIAYREHHLQYPGADLLQTHGAMQLIPSGLPLENDDLARRLVEFWKPN